MSEIDKQSIEQISPQLKDLVDKQSPEHQRIITEIKKKLEKDKTPNLQDNITASVLLLQNLEQQNDPKLKELGQKIIELTNIPPAFLASKDKEWNSVLNVYLAKVKESNFTQKKIDEISLNWIDNTNAKLKSAYWLVTNTKYEDPHIPNFLQKSPQTLQSPADLALSDLLSGKSIENKLKIWENSLEWYKESTKEKFEATIKEETKARQENNLTGPSADELSKLPEAEQNKLLVEAQLDPKEVRQTLAKHPEYTEAWLWIGQIISFLQTDKQLQDKGITKSEFQKNYSKIQNDLRLHPVHQMQTARTETASYNSAMTYTPPTSVNKFSKVSDASLVQMSSKTASGAASPNSPASYAGITSEKLAPDYYQKLPTETIRTEPNSPKGQIRETMTTMSGSQNIKNELAILNNPNGLSSEISKNLSDQQKTITEAMKSFP